MNDLILDKLKEIENVGCNCDLLNGWFCNIHSKIEELKKLLELLEEKDSQK